MLGHGKQPPVGRISYVYDDELHERAKAAADYKGQSLKEWVRRAILAAAERDEADQEVEKTRGRGRPGTR